MPFSHNPVPKSIVVVKERVTIVAENFSRAERDLKKGLRITSFEALRPIFRLMKEMLFFMLFVVLVTLCLNEA